MGKGEKSIFEVPAQALLGEVSCWDNILLKKSKLNWNHQVHAMGDRERERTQTVVGKGVTAEKTNKIPFFVWWWGVAHKRTSGGRQVHLHQTKTVKG